VLDAARNRLYVLTRFDDACRWSTSRRATRSGTCPLHNPEPASVVAGRPFLYDAALTSSNGEARCASCHIFGDMDDLAWDLGNPTTRQEEPDPDQPRDRDHVQRRPAPGPDQRLGQRGRLPPDEGAHDDADAAGAQGSGAMHWRGDRANPPFSAALAFDENNSFNNFNPAFTGLLGNTTQLSSADMQKFTDFALQIMLPPNPNRRIDGTLTASQQAGRTSTWARAARTGSRTTSAASSPASPATAATSSIRRPDGSVPSRNCSFENEEQIFKIPHLRNMYQKIGMFGAIDVLGEDSLNTPFQGDQIRGFGFLHDGAVDTLFRFFHATVFSSTNGIGGSASAFQTDTQRRDVEQFMLGFDTNLAPAVGQQVTLSAERRRATRASTCSRARAGRRLRPDRQGQRRRRGARLGAGRRRLPERSRVGSALDRSACARSRRRRARSSRTRASPSAPVPALASIATRTARSTATSSTRGATRAIPRAPPSRARSARSRCRSATTSFRRSIPRSGSSRSAPPPATPRPTIASCRGTRR
jgi:hypothetical protein